MPFMAMGWPKRRTWREADWGVLLRCLWLIPAVEFSVRWRPPRRWLPATLPSSGLPPPGSASAAPAEQVARWVDAVYRRSPFTPTCLTRSLVLCRILRARGIPCQLHLGMRKRNAELQGHAWIGFGRAPSEAAEFEVILSF